MFYYNPKDGWKVHAKKIKFKEYKEIYSTSDEEYLNNDNYSEVVSEDVILTDLEKSRLDTIHLIPSMGIKDVEAYVFNNVVDDQGLVALKEAVKAEETRQKLAKLIRWDDLTTVEMLDLVDDFKSYEVGAFYVKGDIFNYENQLYKVISEEGHHSQKDWKPETSYALYMPIAPPKVIAEFVLPFGGSGTYELGAKVIFEGAVYENILQGKLNVWSPSAYPQGWKLID